MVRRGILRPLLCQFCDFVVIDRNFICTGFRLRFAVPFLLSQICSGRSDYRVLLVTLVSSKDHSLYLSFDTIVELLLGLCCQCPCRPCQCSPTTCAFSSWGAGRRAGARETRIRWCRDGSEISACANHDGNNLLGSLVPRDFMDWVLAFFRCFDLLWSRSEHHRRGFRREILSGAFLSIMMAWGINTTAPPTRCEPFWSPR